MDMLSLAMGGCAVVGNGPSLAGRGGEIDGLGLPVVRMNNYKAGGRWRKDAGKRVDCWCTSFFRDVAEPHRMPPLVCSPFPSGDRRYPLGPSWNAALRAGRTVVHQPDGMFADLLESVPRPSTGCALLWWLWRLSGRPLDPARLFGFSWFEGTDMHHWDDGMRAEITRHSGDVERDLVEGLMCREAPPDAHPYAVVGFHTVGSPYEAESAAMVESCRRLGIDAKSYPVAPRGSWEANCAAKPFVLLHAFDDMPQGVDLLYLDADARMQRAVAWPEFAGPMAARHRGRELLSGTIFMKRTPECRALLEEWAAAQTDGEWDQRVLQRVGRGRTADIDDDLCHIFDDPVGPPPRIVHGQASRRLKASAR